MHETNYINDYSKIRIKKQKIGWCDIFRFVCNISLNSLNVFKEKDKQGIKQKS